MQNLGTGYKTCLFVVFCFHDCHLLLQQYHSNIQKNVGRPDALNSASSPNLINATSASAVISCPISSRFHKIASQYDLQ